MGTSPSKGYTPNLTLLTAWGGVMTAFIIAIILAMLIGFPVDWRSEEGFLGTGATRMADLTLLAYVLLLVPLMITGFVFARRKKFVPYHQIVMTTIVIGNWGLITFIMAASLRSTLDADVTDNLDYRYLPIGHMVFGLTAQIIGTYLVIRMWFEDSVPAAFKAIKIKPLMRFTLACWLIAAALGIITYVTWYDPFDGDAPVPATPEATEEPTGAPTDMPTVEATTAPTSEATTTPEIDATEESTDAPEIDATPEATDDVD